MSTETRRTTQDTKAYAILSNPFSWCLFFLRALSHFQALVQTNDCFPVNEEFSPSLSKKGRFLVSSCFGGEIFFDTIHNFTTLQPCNLVTCN